MNCGPYSAWCNPFCGSWDPELSRMLKLLGLAMEVASISNITVSSRATCVPCADNLFHDGARTSVIKTTKVRQKRLNWGVISFSPIILIKSEATVSLRFDTITPLRDSGSYRNRC